MTGCCHNGNMERKGFPVSIVETADPDDVATWVAVGERLRKKLPD